MLKTVCVYCSSSSAVDEMFATAARELGQAIGAAEWTLVFGGAEIGLMGILARSVHESGGKVIGVIPGHISERGLAYRECDELMVVESLRERKRVMEELSDAFVALPGGFGTHEELLEILTLKQLHVHKKAIVILNIGAFFKPLLDLFEHLYENRFAKSENRAIYEVCEQPSDAMQYIREYIPAETEDKWF